MPDNSIQVAVNFAWANDAVNWNVPNKVTVNHGDDDTIYWNLNPGNLPPGAASAKFAQTNPIQFVTVKGNNTGSAWPESAPTRVSDVQVSVDDNNTANQTGKRTYYYSINVSTYDANGGLLNTYTKDPEIENSGN